MKNGQSFKRIRTMTKEDAAIFWQRPHHRIMKSKKAYDRHKEKRAQERNSFGSF